MCAKKFNSFSGLVYSTNADLNVSHEENDRQFTPNPEDQKLKVILDKKHRKGKIVTLVLGFEGSDQDLEDLAKKLKTKCGTGGNAKDGEIIIQGDNLSKVQQMLTEWGYKLSK